MIHGPAIPETAPPGGYRRAGGMQIYTAFAIGMAIDLASIYVGNPYAISLATMPIAVLATYVWLKNPMPWIVLVSVVAANPVNLKASVALNLIFALSLVMLNIRCLSRLPSWLYLVLFLFSLSIIGSIVNWETTGETISQLAAVGNYVGGPFFLIPLIYYRLKEERDAKLLLKCFVFSFIVPSATFMFLARLFGRPVIDASTVVLEYLFNVSVYHLGNVDFQLTRTQAGIPLAVLICACFAVIVSSASKGIRLVSAGAMVVSIFLLLVTGSIGSSLAALCGILAILFVGRRYISVKRYVVVGALMLGFAVVGWSLIPEGVKQYAESRYEERFSEKGVEATDRSEIWQLALGYLLDNPEGRGWDLFIEEIDFHPHNDYLAYGIAFGIICVLLYLAIPLKFVISMVGPIARVGDPSRIAILLAGIGAVTVFLLNSFSDHLTANRWYFNVVWSMLWYVYYANSSFASEDLERLR